MEGYQNPIEANLIDQASKKAAEILSRDQIKMADFTDLYGAENVQRDEAYVRSKERNFREGATVEGDSNIKLANIFEALIHEHEEQSDWFGPYATTIKASRYDDILNGVDSIVEFQEPKRPASQLALAIDVTYSHELKDKFQRIKREIEKGELTAIKYFQSENTGIRGEKTNVPRIIIGADPSIVRALSTLWLQGQNNFLGKHPIQFQILEEAILQCRAFAQYAQRIGQQEVAARYENDLHILEEVMQQKSKTLRDTGNRDRVFQEIKSYVDFSSTWK